MYEVIIEAYIHLNSTKNGGREGFIASGYRPNFLFAENINCDGSILFDKSAIFPGENANVTIQLFSLKPIETPYIYAAFEFREGGKVIGNGSVTKNFSGKSKTTAHSNVFN